MKILIVEDEENILNGLVEMVQSFGLDGIEKLYAEKSPERAEKLGKEERVDVLITDVHMKPFDGLELIRRLSAALPGLKTVIVSGYAEFDYAKQALGLGVSEYILKPIDDEELKAVLLRFTDQNKQDDLTDSRLVNKAIEYIKEYFLEEISLLEVSDAIGISYSYLSRIFKKYAGKNFREYLTEQRMRYAASQLSEFPDMKIYEAAEKIGYKNVRDFSSAFRKQFGVLPVEYRNKEVK